MTTPLTPEQVQLSYSSARRCIEELCHGARNWTMSIPARPDYDPDLVISRALEDQQRLIRALTTKAPRSCLMPAERAADDALAEVSRAMEKFPTWPTDPLHALAVVAEELGELTKDVLQRTYEPHKGITDQDIRSEAMQLAAMALRFYLSLPVYQYVSCVQHDQSYAPADTKAADAPTTTTEGGR